MKNELIRLRSIYEEKNNSALRGLDFKIYKGEVVGVVGRFHSGKTLLLEILEGNCVPDQGIRLFAERCVAGRKYWTILKCAI